MSNSVPKRCCIDKNLLRAKLARSFSPVVNHCSVHEDGSSTMEKVANMTRLPTTDATSRLPKQRKVKDGIKKKSISLVSEEQPIVAEKKSKPGLLEERVNASKFRILNEKLYTITGSEAAEMFSADDSLSKTYQRGYRQQQEKWPAIPVDIIIQQLKHLKKDSVIADFGCGEAKIAKSYSNKFTIKSIDLYGNGDDVIVCDMASTPIADESVDVVVFCLSLMGTNLHDYLAEAHRVLKANGILKIAEVLSRFSNHDVTVRKFVRICKKFGFEIKSQSRSYLVDMLQLTDDGVLIFHAIDSTLLRTFQQKGACFVPLASVTFEKKISCIITNVAEDLLIICSDDADLHFYSVSSLKRVSVSVSQLNATPSPLANNLFVHGVAFDKTMTNATLASPLGLPTTGCVMIDSMKRLSLLYRDPCSTSFLFYTIDLPSLSRRVFDVFTANQLIYIVSLEAGVCELLCLQLQFDCEQQVRASIAKNTRISLSESYRNVSFFPISRKDSSLKDICYVGQKSVDGGDVIQVFNIDSSTPCAEHKLVESADRLIVLHPSNILMLSRKQDILLYTLPAMSLLTAQGLSSEPIECVITPHTLMLIFVASEKDSEPICCDLNQAIDLTAAMYDAAKSGRNPWDLIQKLLLSPPEVVQSLPEQLKLKCASEGGANASHTSVECFMKVLSSIEYQRNRCIIRRLIDTLYHLLQNGFLPKSQDIICHADRAIASCTQGNNQPEVFKQFADSVKVLITAEISKEYKKQFQYYFDVFLYALATCPHLEALVSPSSPTSDSAYLRRICSLLLAYGTSCFPYFCEQRTDSGHDLEERDVKLLFHVFNTISCAKRFNITEVRQVCSRFGNRTKFFNNSNFLVRPNPTTISSSDSFACTICDESYAQSLPSQLANPFDKYFTSRFTASECANCHAKMPCIATAQI